MNKGFTVEQASRTIRDAAEAGLRVNASLITGYPYETQEDIEKTAEFIRKNKKYILRIWVYAFSLNYGSPIYLNPARYGIENIIAGRTDFSCGFDENNGLKWAQKQQQQRYSHGKILKIAYTSNIAYNKIHQLFILYCFRLLHFIIVKIKRANYAIISCISRVSKSMQSIHRKCLLKRKERANIP